MSTFVLVHGAWHGAWCWKNVIPELEALGHRAVTPDLPGLGDDPTPADAVTLDDYIARIVEVVDARNGKVVLLGHSMGGMVVTGATEQRPEKIDWLVYLAAFLPRNGECLLALEERNPDPRVPPNVIPSENREILTLRDDMITTLFYHDCTAFDAAWARSRLRPQSAKPLGAPVQTTASRFGSVRRAYIECTDDRAIGIGFQREMIRGSPCNSVISLPCGHSPFFSMPGRLARVLSDLATS